MELFSVCSVQMFLSQVDHFTTQTPSESRNSEPFEFPLQGPWHHHTYCFRPRLSRSVFMAAYTRPRQLSRRWRWRPLLSDYHCISDGGEQTASACGARASACVSFRIAYSSQVIAVQVLELSHLGSLSFVSVEIENKHLKLVF